MVTQTFSRKVVELTEAKKNRNERGKEIFPTDKYVKEK